MAQARTYSAFSSAGTLISVVSVLFYCAGFVRVESRLNEQEKRMSELEKLLKVNLPRSSEASKQDLTMALANETTGVHSDIANSIRNRRHAADDLNTTDVKEKDEFGVKLNKLLSDRMTQLCQRSRQCSRCAFYCFTNIVKPYASLHPGPIYVKEGSNVTLPMCHVTGHPPPIVMWSRPLGKLPQSSVQSNHGNISTLQLISVRGDDSGRYICTAFNPLGSTSRRTFLVVVRLPKFTTKPPPNVTVPIGDTLTLNCRATGDPQPVISWKRLGAQLPVGRNQMSNGALTLKNMKEEDAGIYLCVATSAGVFHESAISNIQVTPFGKDCLALLKAGHTQSGVYLVDPDGRGKFKVYCDMRTDGGGWTVFQRRQDGSVDFSRVWDDYKAGFGQLTGEFWLGNDKIHRLTGSRSSSLRVDLEDWNRVKVYAKYGRFSVGDEQSQYKLEVGSYSGSAGDSLAYHNDMAFSTKDRNNDKSGSNHCTKYYTGGWWFNHCHYAYPNGLYLGKNREGHKGVKWLAFRNLLSLKFTEMKLKSSS